MKYSDKPQFTHDCDACKFLGHVMDNDMYYCPGASEGGGLTVSESGTIILRRSSEGSDYHSGLGFSREWYFNCVMTHEKDVSESTIMRLLLLREAMLRAITRGYLNKDAEVFKR